MVIIISCYLCNKLHGEPNSPNIIMKIKIMPTVIKRVMTKGHNLQGVIMILGGDYYHSFGSVATNQMGNPCTL